MGCVSAGQEADSRQDWLNLGSSPAPAACTCSCSCRLLLFLVCYFILGLRHAHQPLIKPADDVLQSLDAMPGLTRTREFVRLVWKTNHYCRYLSIFKRAKHLFSTRPSRRPVVCLAEN